MPRSFGGGFISSAEQIVDGVITWPKIDSSAIDADLVPDANALRTIGSDSKRWIDVFCSRLKAEQIGQSMHPTSTNNFRLGNTGIQFLSIDVAEIRGDAEAQIFGAGLLG